MNNKLNRFLMGMLFIACIGLVVAIFRFLNEGGNPEFGQAVAPSSLSPSASQERTRGGGDPNSLKNIIPPSPSSVTNRAQPKYGEAVMPQEEPRQIPHTLSETQREENRRELARMAEALPNNMWVPREPESGFHPESGEKLRKSIELSDKIRKGSASSAEQKQYYAYKLKETRDKIELIRYIAGRTEELAGETGKAYLTSSDIGLGEERISELEKLADGYQRRLDEIGVENP